MSDKDKSFGTYVVEGTVLQAGEHVSNGKKVKIPPGIIRRLVENTSKPSPIFDKHGGKNEIGRLMSLIPNEDYSSVEFKSLITDAEIYNNAVVRGYDKISPDIRLDFDDQGNLIDAFLIGASLTNNPGMNFNSVTARKLEFSKGETNMTESWVPPTGTQTDGGTTSEQTAVPPEQTNTEQHAPPVNDAPPVTQQPAPATNNTPSEPTFSASDVTKMVSDAVAAAMRERDAEAARDAETRQRLLDIEKQIKVETNPVNKGLLEDYAKVLAERDNLKQENEGIMERKYHETLESCKTAGIRNPESYVKGNLNLTTEQKITLLENIRANYAKSAPMSEPPKQAMSTSGSSSTSQKKDVTVDMVANYLVGPNNGELKDMLKELSIFKNEKFVGK